MSDPVQAARAQQAQAAIARAAQATGVDFSLLVETARRESALNPNARAGTSSATGLFQFIESTWLDMVRRHGAQHGMADAAAQIGVRDGRAYVADPDTRSQILALRTDPEAAARMAAELARENAATLEARLGRAPSAGELYAAHVMGPSGAARLIEAAQAGAPSAADIFPREAAANRGLFYASGEAVSARALLNRLDLDASATIGSGAEEGRVMLARSSGEGGALSPALAQALFQMALLPLLQNEPDRTDPFAGLAAYARAQRGI